MGNQATVEVAKPLQDFNMAVAQGAVKNTNNNLTIQTSLSGANVAIGSAGFVALKTGGGSFLFPQAAEFVRVASGGNVNDTALGTGATAVLVGGIGEDFERITELIPLNGIDASANSLAKFWRVNFAVIAGAGTYGGTNVGPVTIEFISAGVVVSIDAGQGLSTVGVASTPKQHRGFIEQFIVQVESNQSVIFRVFRRARFDDVTTFAPAIRLIEFVGVQEGPLLIPLANKVVVEEKSDFWVEARASAGNASATAILELKLVPTR